MRRRTFLRTAGSVATLTAAATSGSAGAAESGTTHVVEMNDQLAFVPERIEVAPGDTVVWENVGSQGHSVTAYEDSIPEGAEYWASGGFDSQSAAEDAYSASGSIEETGNVPSGESYSHTFETEGTHEYFCIPHEAGGMVGQIEVSADADPGGDDGVDDSLPIGIPGLILGGLGIGVVSFITGAYYGGKRKGREQSTAALAGAGAIGLGFVLMIAVVARLLLGA